MSGRDQIFQFVLNFIHAVQIAIHVGYIKLVEVVVQIHRQVFLFDISNVSIVGDVLSMYGATFAMAAFPL